MNIDSEEAAMAELSASLEILNKEARNAARVQKIMRGEKPDMDGAEAAPKAP